MKCLLLRQIAASAPRLVIFPVQMSLQSSKISSIDFAVDPMLVSKFENKFSDHSLRTPLTYVFQTVSHRILQVSPNSRIFLAAMIAHPSLKIEKKY
jgi:hypothetical protein